MWNKLIANFLCFLEDTCCKIFKNWSFAEKNYTNCIFRQKRRKFHFSSLKFNFSFVVRFSIKYMRIKLLSRNNQFKITNAVKSFNSVYLTINSLYINSHQQCVVIIMMPQLTGWPAWTPLVRVSRSFEVSIL